MHHHFVPDIYRQALQSAGWPTPSWTTASSLQNMRANGVHKTILCLSAPGPVIASTNASIRTLARRVNEYAASIRDQHPSRFGFFAALPSLLDEAGTLAEIEYALDTLHADGVYLLTRYGDANYYLGHPAFTRIWEALDARGTLVFIHPTVPLDTALVNPLLRVPTLDYPQETTRAALDMIITNVTGRFPNCSRILPHGGGTLPYLISRVAMTSREMRGVKKMFGKTYDELMYDFRSFYYDLSLASAPAVVRLLLELVPRERLLYGSDFPYADGDKIVGFREELDAFPMSRELREMIYFRNAEALLS
ncbi:2-amino-3-carboxymuconate-6-semialdehyde decarboxylase [Aspergillus steynii IBT 23096]|uniref:6-methylsalicylate decarboxylase n=1 Tax=Aspergillus steynii IBT 23096 TaxID=1392250 RepID=A0A2I2G129_9EURO|nr:2-amino-3-carboxymuconate-6-semialdehyde decarboxylase [Aspergillus steynii IBT 23096]PLB46571.1 2-amino-3-carboxymuconate-6-semialdehyde decarboxylase [Aspergillus steynii IBT 23096]